MFRCFNSIIKIVFYIVSIILSCNAGPVCKDPPKPVKNAVATSYSNAPYNFGDTFVYSCEDPLFGISPNITECLHDGTWSLDPYLPACIKKRCGPPPKPGRVTYVPVKNLYELGESVSYECAPTYASNQTGFRSTCRAVDLELYWDLKDFPDCVAACSNPERIANAEIYGAAAPYLGGKTIFYKCKGVFDLNIPQVEAISTCQSDRTWTRSSSLQNLPVCYCSVPPVIENGNFTPPGPYLPGHAIVFSCYDKYQLKGSTMQVCQSNGGWLSAKFPKCVKVLVKPTEDPHLKCYKCDWDNNPYCYYATHKRLISYEDCSATSAERASCETRFVVKKGAVVEVKRSCKYSSWQIERSTNSSRTCRPDKQKDDMVECTVACATRECNTISANELRPCPACTGHSYCDHFKGECKCKKGYNGQYCQFYMLARKDNKQNFTVIPRNVPEHNEKEAKTAQKSGASHVLPTTILMAFSVGLLLN